MVDTIRLDGRVALVTGAGGGLGRAHAVELAARGASVLVNDIGGAVDGSGSDAGAAQRVVEEIRAAGGTAAADTHDVRDGAAIVQAAVEAFGGLHIVVNNAGILRDAAFHKLTREAFDAVVDVHLRGSAAVTLAAFRIMREQRYGRIVNTTSSAGLLGSFGQANYGAAKGGLYGLTRVLAVEGGARGVLTNAIMPVAATRMSESLMSPQMRAELAPARVSPVVAYLASEECALNGEVLNVGAGAVSRYFLGLTPGWGTQDLTAEDVAEHLADILDETGYTVFRDAQAAAADLMASLPLPAGGRRLATRPAAVDPALFGTSLPPVTFRVEAEKVEAFGRATADENPVYQKGAVAPAVYAFPVAFDAVTAATAALLPPALQARTVHGAHDIHVRRPILPGAVLTTTAQPWGLRTHGSAARLSLRLVTTDEAGDVVIEQFGQFALRGVTDLPDLGSPSPAFRLPDGLGAPAHTRTVTIATDQPARYAGASGDHSAIHLDEQAAQAAGLPGVILQGICTLAMSAAAVTDAVADGDPARIARVAVRFSALTLPGSPLTTSVFAIPDGPALPGRTTWGFTAESGGRTVLKDGIVEVFG